MGALERAPAKVRTETLVLCDEVDLFDRVLADIPDRQIAGLAIE